MAAPTIEDLPEAPVRGEAPETFSTKANEFVAALSTFGVEANAIAAWCEEVAIALNVLTAETDALITDDTSRDLASSDSSRTLNPTAAIDYGLPTGICYDGALITIVTDASAVTVTPDGTTLQWKKGGAQETGAITIAAHSMVTLVRKSSTVWAAGGNGIST